MRKVGYLFSSSEGLERVFGLPDLFGQWSYTLEKHFIMNPIRFVDGSVAGVEIMTNDGLGVDKPLEKRVYDYFLGELTK